MARIKKLRQRHADLVAESQELFDAADRENRSLTDNERTRDDEIEAELRSVTDDIMREDRRLDRRAAITADEGDNVTSETRATEGTTRASFDSFGGFLQAVARAGNTNAGQLIDPRLRAATGLNEGVPSDGGFLVGKDETNELMRRVYESSMLMGRVRRIPISANSNGVKINALRETSRADGSRLGGVTSYWEGEADLFTGSRPKFRVIELDLKKLTGLCYATGELLQDASALETIIREAFTEEFAFKGEDAVMNGTGAGQPLGYLNSGCVIEVAAEGSQTTDTINRLNVFKMWSRLWSRSRANSIWVINQDCLTQIMDLKAEDDSPLYLPAGAYGAPQMTLMGRPIVEHESAATLGDAGDIQLVDLSQYLWAEKGGLQADQSMHVRFLYDEMTFRFIWRVDGQPAWDTALTPKNGSNTLSPFITLAAR